MQKILVKIAVILAIVFGLDRLTAYYLDSLHEKNEMNFGDGHLNHFIKQHRADTLLMGSSRMLYHIDPSLFGPEAYNLSKNGMHIGYQAAALDLLKQHNKLPTNTLILHIEPDDLLGSSMDKIYDDIHSLRHYYGENDFITKMINRRSFFEHFKYWSELYRHNGRGLQLLTKPSQKTTLWPTENGFDTLGVRLDLTNYDCASADNDDLPSFRGMGQFIGHIQKICKEAKIDLICITTPRYCVPTNYNKCIDWFRRNMNHNKTPYFSYQHHSFQDDPSLWSDEMHLNGRGAKILSEQVYRDILSIRR